jgi:NAD(P)-dependent dehydrogenase (short-subunit alcohol dehydrogenase family)
MAGKAGVVTGAAQGLGFASALALGRAGASLVVADLDGAKAELAVAALAGEGVTATAVTTDVRDPASIRAAIDACVDAFGSFDFIHNNAGVLVGHPLLDVTPEEIELMWSVNVGGVFWGCRHAVEVMRDQGRGGSIVNTASMVAFAGDPLIPIYTATKHAVLGLTRALAVDPAVAAARVRVNCVCPGDMDTPMNDRYFDSTLDPAATRAEVDAVYPRGRMGEPAEVAAAVVFLASDAASFVNGAALPVDGGLLAKVY